MPAPALSVSESMAPLGSVPSVASLEHQIQVSNSPQHDSAGETGVPGAIN